MSEVPTETVAPTYSQAELDQIVAQKVAEAQAAQAGQVVPEGAADPGSYGEGEGQESDKTHAQQIEERIAALEAKVFSNDNTEGTQT